MTSYQADAAVEERTQELGRALLEVATRYRGGPAERIEDWLLTRALANDRFRARLLRYMDVLAALDFDSSGREAKRLAREYFGDEFPELPRALRWLLRIARDEHLPAAVVGETARRAAELFARRFITPPGIDGVTGTIDELAGRGRYPTFDLLGEAVLSDAEATAYVDAYVRLIEQLSDDPAAGVRTVGDAPALQVSLKLSSLTSHFSAVDPEGTVERVRPALEAIADAARDAGVGVAVDMEQHELRDVTWQAFRRVFAAGERHGDWSDAGIVLQGYLRDAPGHASEMIEFARARGVPFQVRLVKGAYWDYETIVAAERRWPAPVLTEKSATDSQFEELSATLIGAYPRLRLAVGSHNVRAHAVAEAQAEAAGLPGGAVEHQTLFRTAEGTSRALSELGWVARDYVPVGELLPGMAYLVRRVIENSSQAGFLLQSRSGASPEDLLRAPARRAPATETVRRDRGPFQRAPAARWFDGQFRDEFERALVATREEWGASFDLVIAGEPAEPEEVVAIHSPSHPLDGPVGRVALAGEAAAMEAVRVAGRGAEGWRDTSASTRAGALRRAAELLEDRAAQFAARVVHEGGRDRSDAYAEVEEAVDYLNYYAVQAEELFSTHGHSITARGVVAVIPPWNFSLAIPCGMTAAALAAGNAVVLKPAEQTPIIAVHLARLLHEAGIPRDALICLPGRGEPAGRTLVESAGVSMVAFTGSRAVGVWMHEAVSRVELAEGSTKALVAEMGGKNPILVFADADLDEAVSAIVASAFGHANQKCSAASWVLVERPILDRLRARLVEAARSLEVGPADAPATRINPVIDRQARERLLAAAETARVECEVLLDRFEGEGELELGPLIVQIPADRARKARTTSEELFGPVLALIPFDDEQQAFDVANGTDYGLTAGIFSRSPSTIGRAVRALEVGNVYVNRNTTGARVGVEPFGGMRMSGTGPKAGSTDYLWAFVRRTDAPADEAGDLDALASAAPTSEPALLPGERFWAASLDQRLAAVEGAAVLLGEGGEPGAATLLAAAQSARRELAVPQETLQVAGQRTELRYDTPRGLGIVRARGDDAAWWLAGALLAGNTVALFDSPALAPVVTALLRAGVPSDVLRLEHGGVDRMLAAARGSDVAFGAIDGGPAVARALWRELGPTAQGQRSLKALISPLDGPQPLEQGFLRRFAWPKVVAVRTLRHGADLALDVAGA
ncbi:MAG: proline dehydrogenase family protein [Dehalococcoidia bacterium]